MFQTNLKECLNFLLHITTNTDWLRYCQKGNYAPHLTHTWTFFNPNCVHNSPILWNFLIYSLERNILTQFKLKMTVIGEYIAKKVILRTIWTIFRPYLA